MFNDDCTKFSWKRTLTKQLSTCHGFMHTAAPVWINTNKPNVSCVQFITTKPSGQSPPLANLTARLQPTVTLLSA